jgi:hypothetical protein
LYPPTGLLLTVAASAHAGRQQPGVALPRRLANDLPAWQSAEMGLVDRFATTQAHLAVNSGTLGYQHRKKV